MSAVIERVVVDYRYDVIMPDGRRYLVKRTECAGRSDWSVINRTWREGWHSRHCDPDGRTHKRVVAAVQALLTPWGTVAA